MQVKQISDNELYETQFGYKEQRSNAWFLFVLCLIIWAVACFRVWWTSNFGGVVVDGNSMYTTLTDNEKLLMRYVDDKNQAKRGDIIVVYVGNYEECSSVTSGFIIKRLIATAGDKVRCENGEVEICYAGSDTFVPLLEPYAYYGKNEVYKPSYDFAEYTVGDGEIFFLGDNRSSGVSSVDSRYKEEKSHLQGLYKVGDIYGTVPAWALKNQKFFDFLFF